MDCEMNMNSYRPPRGLNVFQKNVHVCEMDCEMDCEMNIIVIGLLAK